jgi:hypothetical protein
MSPEITRYRTIDVQNIEIVKNDNKLQELHGTVFLHPKRADWIEVPTDGSKSSDACLMRDYYEICKNKGKHVLCLKVWVWSPESDNWAYHLNDKIGLFPEWIPIDYFFNKKEGDKVEILCKEKGKKLILTCEQKGSRDQNMGLFEEGMEEMFMVTYNQLCLDYRNHNLSLKELEQWKIIDELKFKYYPSSMIAHRGFTSAIEKVTNLNKKGDAPPAV